MKMYKLLAIGVAFSVFSCTKTLYVDRVEYQKGKDSTVYVTKDTTIYVSAPNQFNEVVTTQKSHLQTDYSYSNAWIDDSLKLHHNIGNAPNIPQKIKYEYIYKLKIDTVYKKDTQIVEKKVEVPYVPWKAWLGWILLGLAGIWKFRKFFGISI